MSKRGFSPNDRRIFFCTDHLPDGPIPSQECWACHRMAVGSEFCSRCRALASEYLETGSEAALNELMLLVLGRLHEDAEAHVMLPPPPTPLPTPLIRVKPPKLIAMAFPKRRPSNRVTAQEMLAAALQGFPGR
jgi:hypothetical protein